MDPIRDIHDATNIALQAQNALGFALPPFLPFRDFVRVQSSDNVEASAEMRTALSQGLVENTNWIVPLTFKADGLPDFKFPLDPIISLSSKNIITRRYVNKSGKRGSIKERWSQDDWEISISGLIIGDNKAYPTNTLKLLRDYCNTARSVKVECILFSEMDILRIAIESVEFPFTKGEENQAFVIRGYSDDEWDLLINN